ncbi:MAG TPA: ATP-binding protein [Gemmatimonadaceae bacterium]|nr:ATP-binding protein [Gemmatimonadaceae bacterium]
MHETHHSMSSAARRRPDCSWAVAAALAIVAAAAWLRVPGVRYLAICAGATGVAVAALVWLTPSRRRWALPCVAALGLFIALAAVAQRQIWRVDRAWLEVSERSVRAGTDVFAEEVARIIAALRQTAAAALDAPLDAEGAFERLRALARAPEERGVVLERGGVPFAWGGTLRLATAALPEGVGVSFTPFYVTLHAVESRGTDRAVAVALLHADPPGNRLAPGLAELVTSTTGVRGFELARPGAALGPVSTAIGHDGATLLGLRALAPIQSETRLRLVERARVQGAILLVLSLVGFLVAVWRHARPLLPRFAAIGIGIACVAIIPLNEFSNATRLFDPGVYFAPLGGPFTASIGALGLTSALILLALLGVLRSRIWLRSRWLALTAVLVIAGLGPFLLRDLARGIAPPAWGVDISLWLGWQVTLFLAAVSVLLAGASAGRVALGTRRGLTAAMAPALAAVAALLGPVLWEAPGRWPGWYPALWIAAIAALALGRRGRRVIPAAAIVAGLGAATLVWGANLRQRVALAERDVLGLSEVDPTAAFLLERFADQLADLPTPSTRAELLRRYVTSDLAFADFPVHLTAWGPGGSLVAELSMAEGAPLDTAVRRVVERVLAADTVLMESVLGVPGIRLVLALRHPGGGASAVAVDPRTRLIPDDPFALLLGIAPDPPGEPPYSLLLTDVDVPPSGPSRASRWQREGNELHGDWRIQTADGERRVHVEVELRSLDALIQRGALILLLNLGVLGGLWILSALADGGYGRWLRRRRREWVRSYRARLSLALAGFFIVPALLFATWSYRRLQSDDQQARELLVRETLRTVAATLEPGQLGPASERLATPLLLYSRGELRRTSDELYELLAPISRFLPPSVHLAVSLGDEVTASQIVRVGTARALFGYRATVMRQGDRAILAAPAPTNEVALDRRRSDLGILVLFATAVGVLAAIWLSGLAARQLARPIASLRRAALAVAAGEREPPLAIEPPAEFVPVFTAFRQMAADLTESRSALEEAQRRTAAILRNVASGVIAVGPDSRITLANPRAEALFGVPLPSRTPIGALGVQGLDTRVRSFVDGESDEEQFDIEVEGRQLQARLTRLVRGGGAVLTLDDVTELARAQRILAWGEMARQVAHEIKNPLTPIRLGVQHLKRARADRRGDFDRILDQNVTRILAEIDRLDEIARAFSRYGSAPADRPPTEPTDVAAIVRDVVALETMGESDVAWRLAGTDDAALAHARADELREVLLNLLENSRHAGAKAVDVTVRRDDGVVQIEVRDDGAGIPPEVLPRIFEPHFSTRTSGSGLGLAISRRIVDSWGGSIDVTSERGAGTSVEIVLRRWVDKGSSG